MAEEKLYKILKNASNGWFLIEDRAMNLTKENCDQMLRAYFNGGENPNDIKAVLQNDPRYPTTNIKPGFVPPPT